MAKAAAKKGRVTRTETTRDANTREFQSRPMEHKRLLHTLDIPMHLVPRGKRYFWARHAVGTTGGYELDTWRVSNLMMDGWTPVPASRHPELCPLGLGDDDNKYRDYIRRQGSILMEIDERIAHARDMQVAQETKDSIMQLKGAEEFAQEYVHVKFTENENKMDQPYRNYFEGELTFAD